MPNAINLTGQRFGRLLVIAAVSSAQRGTRWLCTCDCGKQKTVATNRLRRGETSSCGCLRSQMAGASLRTHGATNTLTWKRWRSMINRCTMVNAQSYSRYGGRGIRVCDRWQQFENFREDMGDCPSPGHTLDRTNFDGHYEPGNCRWATQLEQNRNHSANRMLTFQGETLCAAEWAERTGMNLRTIYSRMNKGWSAEQIFTTPVKPQRPRRPNRT